MSTQHVPLVADMKQMRNGRLILRGQVFKVDPREAADLIAMRIASAVEEPREIRTVEPEPEPEIEIEIEIEKMEIEIETKVLSSEADPPVVKRGPGRPRKHPDPAAATYSRRDMRAKP